jgi:hypothetical protein
MLVKAKLMSSPRKDLMCQNVLEVKENFLVIAIDDGRRISQEGVLSNFELQAKIVAL